MKTNELIDTMLDLAVVRALGYPCEQEEPPDCLDWIVKMPGEWLHIVGVKGADADTKDMRYSPSTNWSQGGPIIERERISVMAGSDAQPGHMYWTAEQWNSGDSDYSDGPTPLIAAMRRYVASKLGDDIDIPKELSDG